MDERRELLRRLLSATGAAGRLSPEQHEEILGHLEDSVEAKIAGGASEMEAGVRALEELGDIGKIAGQFPKAPVAALATADGPGFRWAVHGTIVESFLVFLAFCLFQLFVMPKVIEVFVQVGVGLPPVTRFFVELCHLMGRVPLATLAIAGVIGTALLVFARRPYVRQAAFLLGLLSIILTIGGVIGATVPLVAIGSGIGR